MKNLYLVFFACILLLCGCNGVGEKDTLLARINDEKVYTEDEQILVKMTGGANSTDRSYFLYNRVFSKVALASRGLLEYPELAAEWEQYYKDIDIRILTMVFRELDDIYKVCQRYGIPLYIDGARLGYGLMAEVSDITLPYLARHCDVFYIGGTKIGALCGEAVVFTNRQAHKHFFSIQKQHGAVIAKGALIGLQFEALFTDDLYFKLSEHAIKMAMRMKQIFQQKGIPFYVDSPTNQQFIVLPDAEVERLSQQVQFTHFGQTDKHCTICRFVTSWATTEEEINELERLL